MQNAMQVQTCNLTECLSVLSIVNRCFIKEE